MNVQTQREVRNDAWGAGRAIASTFPAFVRLFRLLSGRPGHALGTRSSSEGLATSHDGRIRGRRECQDQTATPAQIVRLHVAVCRLGERSRIIEPSLGTYRRRSRPQGPGGGHACIALLLLLSNFFAIALGVHLRSH